MVAVPVAAGVATLVAVTVTTPGEEGAVNVTGLPEVLVAGENEPPPVEDQVTPRFPGSLVRVAVIMRTCEVARPSCRGFTVTLEPPEDVIVTTAAADLVGSAWATAVTVTVAGVGRVAGAV
jgi:hypothetical protein